MKNKNLKILGMPIICSIVVVSVCLLGILIGSFLDFQISDKLKNVTDLGSYFNTYGSYFSYCLYPAAGMCLFKGLIKKNKNYTFLAWVLLVLSYFLAVYYSDSYNGSKVRQLFGYVEGDCPFYISLLAYLFWVVLYSWVPLVFYFILDDANPNALFAVGITILLAGVVSDCTNLWLKQVGSRPRFKYLLTLTNPKANFRNWWEMNPYKAGSNDNFKSWPSGNMTIATMMFSLPMLMSNIRKTNKVVVTISFGFAASFVVLYGYNRIHMTNHFLSDVCWGVLITYCIFAIVGTACEKSLVFNQNNK